MRTILLALLAVILMGCSSAETTSVPTQTVPEPPVPTQTTESTITPAPTDQPPSPTATEEQPSLLEILFRPGDLSISYTPQGIRTSLPKQLSDLPKGIEVVSQTFLNVVYTSEITIIVYETYTDTTTAYAKAIELIQQNNEGTMKNRKFITETTTEVGDQASIIYMDDSLVGYVDLVFTNCSALINIHLMSNEATSHSAIRYGKNIEKRIEPLVCQD